MPPPITASAPNHGQSGEPLPAFVFLVVLRRVPDFVRDWAMCRLPLESPQVSRPTIAEWFPSRPDDHWPLYQASVDLKFQSDAVSIRPMDRSKLLSIRRG